MRSLRAVVVLASMSVATVAAADTTDPVSYPNRCGTVMPSPDLIDDVGPAVPYHALTQRVIFLNRFGGAYTVAAMSNAVTNVVARGVTSSGVTSFTIPPMASTFNWANIVTCVKKHYEPFNVRIVESEPTTGTFVEGVVGGNGTEIGRSLNEGILGIAAINNNNICVVTEGGVAFSFSEPHKTITQPDNELCATIAHEVGHLLALEHETASKDVMSYVPFASAGSKAFLDMASPCGTYPNQETPCSCGGSSTNSGNRLDTFVGERPVETTKPTLGVDSPRNNATVGPVFELVAEASDDQGMGDVRVLVDGVESGNAQVETDGKWRVKVTAPLGTHTLRVISRDLAGNELAGELSVTVEKAELGDDCAANDSCTSNLCAQTVDDGSFCTQTCNVADGDSCPDGFSCEASGAAAYCIEDSSSGCGCQSAQPRDAVGGLVVFGLGALLLRRRRTGSV